MARRAAIYLVLALVSPTALAKVAAKVPAKQASTPQDQFDVGLGGGLLIAFPPMVTLQSSWRVNRMFNAGIEAGYLNVPVEQFEGRSSYVGVDGKVAFSSYGTFAGLSVGRRTFDIVTKNALYVGGIENDVTWTRHVSQEIVYPKLGWMHLGKTGHAFVFAAGVVVPVATSFSMEHDPKFIQGGLSSSDLAVEEENRADDVKKVTNANIPSIELKYIHFFDWLP